jgi:hypothetical protein
VRIGTATLAALAAVLACATASATPSARLVYSRAHGAESCPDEQALRSAVAARVGYDPFFPWAKQTVVATMSVAPAGGFAASVSLVDEQGVDHGKRTFRAQGECRELVDVAALAIAIAIDPRSLMPHPPSPPPEPVGPAPPAAPALALPHVEPAPEIPPPPEPAPARTVFEATAGAVASDGVAIPPTFGGVLGAAVRRGRLSLGVEGRIDVPATADAPAHGSLSSELFAVALVPCLHLGRVFACALGQVGRQNDASHDVPNAMSRWTTWAAVGGRFGVEAPLQGTLGLRVRSDVVGDLRRRTLQVDGVTNYWIAPALATSLGIDAVVHFQ